MTLRRYVTEQAEYEQELKRCSELEALRVAAAEAAAAEARASASSLSEREGPVYFPGGSRPRVKPPIRLRWILDGLKSKHVCVVLCQIIEISMSKK